MAKVSKRTLPSGTVCWRAVYRDANGKRRSKQFNRKSDGEAWLHRTKVAVADGVHIADSDAITVGQAATLWLDTCDENDLAAATVRQYRQHVKNYIENPDYGIGGLRVTALTSGRVKQFHADVKKNRSRVMADKALKSLRLILSDAQVRGKVVVNVARAFRPPRNKKSRQRAARLPPKDALRSLLNHKEPKWQALLTVAILTGLRGQELRGLQWSDIDLKNGIIHVLRAADIYADLKEPKSVAGERDVPMAPMVIGRLKAWKLECPVTDLGLVFPNQAGKVMAQNCIHQNLWSDLDLGFRFHDLRHAAASLFIEAEMPPKRLSEVMGHSSIQVTFDLYGHLWPDPLGTAAIMALAQAALLSSA